MATGRFIAQKGGMSMPWALVTGASSGIGLAVAVKLSKNYSIILGGRDADRLENTKAMCNPNARVMCWPCDISDIGGLALHIQNFLRENDIVVDAFVHCAGYSKLSPVKMTTVEDVEKTFRTNVYSPFVIIQQLINRGVNHGALKSVVLVSSNISGRGARAFSIYGSSKHAVDGLMRSLAVELAPKIRVNSVCPGAVNTRMTESIFANKEVIERMKRAYPLGIGIPSNIADAVAFLLSESASWITGQSLVVDGGAAVDISA